MKTRVHALAGVIGFFTILTFWTSTVFSELLASYETVTAVKQYILYGMFLLIPAMAIAGASGISMGKIRTDTPAKAKMKRMPLIGLNGMLILLPSAIYLASKAAAGSFDAWFYSIQTLELVAGAANLTMMGLNIRDGLKMTGRIAHMQNSSSEGIASPVIEVRDNGPLVGKGIPRLVSADGEAFEVKPVVALCRCGASKIKPFCDGSHNEIEFDSRPTDERTADNVRAYEGKDITVQYNGSLCSHAGECVKLRAVFDTARRPWILPDNGSVEDIVDVVTACPSGALSYSLPGQLPQHVVAGKPGISIDQDGPYRVTAVRLNAACSATGACPDKYVLCRCGASKNKPYCDGTHRDINWRS